MAQEVPTEAEAKPIPELSDVAQAAAIMFFRPMERIARPRFYGVENIPPERPLMFVGNHQLLSIDTPFLITELWKRKIQLRALGDNFLFAVPGLAQFLRAYGLVRASPQAAATLLRRGESLLVYPGGAREASKNAGHRHLDWWDRLGFARVALEQRCTIVPVAATGVDDRIRILLSPESYLDSPLGTAADKLGLRRDMFLPFMVPRGMPRPAFMFCQPVRVQRFLQDDPDTAVRKMRTAVADAIETSMTELKRIVREEDKED